MVICPKCSAKQSVSSRTCEECGTLLPGYQTETAILPSDPLNDTPTKALENEMPPRSGSSSPSDPGAFVAGTVLAGRYRIIALIGKGGMGEVYKAEDLELDQTIALKFLPKVLSQHEDFLRRFRGEVRNARQVSHRNVCRVFDIGETDGLYYLTMEYIDGDDLSMLLRRIGRLPSDKAIEISREVCMGLAAIHKTGILHRDLKPANIIIDSKGEARITDFGISMIATEVEARELRVGTPAYMSPEQAEGRPLTVQSDIYSLGLVLYEIFTGKQAFEASSSREFSIKHAAFAPKRPSEVVPAIDSGVEDLIRKCLEKEPKDRPNSAMSVAMALPGGDPLQMAIAAGETPTPDMVAAVPKTGALKPGAAAGLLMLFLVGFFGVIIYQQFHKSYGLLPLERSPDVLAERSRSLLASIGHSDPVTDTDHAFVKDDGAQTFIWNIGSSTESGLPSQRAVIEAGRPVDLYFLYRQSSEHHVPIADVEITESDPPLSSPGMARVKLDSTGRLIELARVPSPAGARSYAGPTDWGRLFDEAGLDIESFAEAAPSGFPPVFSDERSAWKGPYSEFENVIVRVEAAKYQGELVYFTVVPPWAETNAVNLGSEKAYRTAGTIIILAWIVAAILVSTWLAYRNLRNGRGDLRGGLKLVVVLFSATVLSQLLVAHHVPSVWGELSIIYKAMSYGMVLAVCTGVLYIALEPYVRRSWAELLISWSRLLNGNLRDPMIGRDILIGGLCGIGHTFGIMVGLFLRRTLTADNNVVNSAYNPSVINGVPSAGADFLMDVAGGVIQSLIILFLLFIAFRLSGRKFLAVVLVGTLIFVLQVLFFAFTQYWVLAISALINSVCFVIAVYRSGLLGMIAFWILFSTTYLNALTLDPSKFFFGPTIAVLGTALAIIVYAFYTSMAGQRVFNAKLFEE